MDPKGMDGNGWIICLWIRKKSRIFKKNLVPLYSDNVRGIFG
jgi:hypothetical protein